MAGKSSTRVLLVTANIASCFEQVRFLLFSPGEGGNLCTFAHLSFFLNVRKVSYGKKEVRSRKERSCHFFYYCYFHYCFRKYRSDYMLMKEFVIQWYLTCFHSPCQK